MPDKVIENFIDGLNLFVHPTQIKDSQCQRLENMEVRPTNVGNNLTYLALTARYSYSRLHTQDLSFTPHNLIEYVVRGLGSVVYTSGTGGTGGASQVSFAGAYTGTIVGATVVVSIDSVGGVGVADQLKWSINGVVQASGVAITGSLQSLGQGISVDFLTTGSTTHWVAGDSWTINVSPNGERYLVVGGYDTAGSAFVVKALRDNQTALTLISSQITTNSSICSFLLFNQNLYYTNGVVPWRRWNGVNDVASGFTTITKYATKHKNKAIYLNDISNNRPNRIWVSNTGDPESVPSSNSFDIGDFADALVGGIDQLERLLLIKEKSLYGFYLAPTLSDSSILRGDEWKGSISPLGIIWGPFGTFIYSARSGMQAVSGLYVSPTVLQLYNQLKGFQNKRAALGFDEDQLLISTLSSSGQSRNNRIYTIDLLDEDNQKVYQWNVNISLFCQNHGILTFNNRMKAIEDDGTNRFIVELNQIASVAEASFDCIAQTKDFMVSSENLIPKVQVVNYVVVDFIAPNTTNALTLEIFADGASVQNLSFIPTTTGFNRRVFYTSRHLSRGYRISFRLTYTQTATDVIRFAILRIGYNYDIEERVEN